ncbi:MAG TPA: AAA family ATPase [Ktedonobacteraceae bacterium]
MSVLSLCLFGPPRIEIDGIAMSVDTRKAVALIAYLAIMGQQHSRDSLAALLWPENDQSHARAALRRTLSALNKALKGVWLDIDRETIGLNFHAGLQIDVQVFRRLLAECRTHGHPANETCAACEQPLTAAVALYQSDFLAGFSLRDSPEFDDWQLYQADTLRREFAGALEGLTHCHSAAHHFDTAILYARRWLALDRLHEPAHRQLMLLYAWAGQRTAALRQYRECVQVFEQELGVSPLESTSQLYQLIKENHIPLLPPPLPELVFALEKQQTDSVGTPDTHNVPFINTPKNPAIAAYPLVGRAEEWATMLKMYHAIEDGGRVIILEGDAGIGKTRLADELLAYARSGGANGISARCYEGESHLAYAPIVSALRTAIAQQDETQRLDAIPASWLSEAVRLLPELATLRPGLPPAPALDNPGAQTRFFEGLRQLFLTLSAGNAPGILFFDDLHWVDGASLEWLSYLLRRLDEAPLCLLFTWRGKQPARGTPLRQLFVEAQRSGKAAILSLSRLSEPSVRELAQSIVTVHTTNHFVDRLYAETEGIPFFLVEYLSAIEKGVLKTEQVDWSLTGGIRGLLSSRLSAVNEIGWQLLNTAAVIGRSFDFDTLREASGRSEDETVTALEDLIAQGLVEEIQRNAGEHQLSYDFSHEKLRAFVYEETSLARRRLLHHRTAEALASHTRGHRDDGPRAGQIAHHYRLAGNDAAAADYFKLAGEYARTLYANAEALAHLQLALALGHPAMASLHEAIGDLYTLLGEYNDALNSYETAAAICAADALARIEHKLGAVYMRRGEWKAAESHLEAALNVSEGQDQPNQQASIYADWSLTVHHQGQARQALELAHRALDLAETSHDTHSLAQAHNMLGMLASHQRLPQEARHHLEQSLALTETLNDPGIRAAALNNLAQAYQSNGELERALALTEDALALCVSQGDRHREAALNDNLADLLHTLGQTEAAMVHLKRAVGIYAEIGVEAGTVQTEIWKLSEW